MTSERSDAARRQNLLRFDLAVQKNHMVVYILSLLSALFGQALGVIQVQLRTGLILWAISFGCIVAYYFLLKRGADRRIITILWIATDVVFVSTGVYVTGGIGSPYYLWYIATGAATAFVLGKRASYLICALNFFAYLVTLLLMGQARFFNDILLLGACRMLFLGGASYFFLTGISNLQEKRLEIRRLKVEESRKVEELTRLTAELQRRTDELADANVRSREADRLKSQFLANMSHELRTPMNSIIGFSEILVERLDGKIETKQVNFLRHILASGQHLLGIINDILDLSKIEAGKMEIYPEYFAIGPVVESVCHVMRGMAKAKPPTFIADVSDDLPQIETDLAKFKQILFNLLSNSVKFAPADRPIVIRARYLGAGGDGAITVSVQDEGIGIDPKDHGLIFEEFRQVDGTVKREFGGTGLGLALVKKFVELQGGHVTVESSPGAGSTFSFTLPVHSRAAVVSRGTDLGGFAGEREQERVLVIEDDANAYELINAALSSAGYISIRARHGDEALRLARESRPCAITLDLVLPGLDGWEVLKRLKTDPETRDIPVVIISMVDNRELGVALGADDYFVKPVDRERLLGRIRQITAGGVGRQRLLLIDDDTAVHALLDEELTALGYSIESAFTGEAGVAAARENAPDVIILDLMMPGMSGFEVASSLKDHPQTANIPILVLTSKEISGEDRRELQNKVATVVQKGTSAREQLVREIRRLEGRRVIMAPPGQAGTAENDVR